MSTTYYALRHPVRSVTMKTNRYSLRDENGAWLGSLLPRALHLAADRDTRVAHRSGSNTIVYSAGPDAEQAISEYGELVTLGQLRRGDAP